jgi:hypothetical protein
VSHPEYPGQILFMDLIHNPSQTSITKSTFFPYYLLIVCAFSRYGALIGCHDSTSKTIIACITTFSVYHRPHLSYTLHDIAEIHADAGTYFTSQVFKDWGLQLNIAIIIAGAHHQEMNGLCERRWQAIRLRAFCTMNHARLAHAFMHFSLMYSCQITAVLPLRGLFIKDNQGQDCPCTPYEKYFSQKPRIGRFRVFGCPIVAKCYFKKHPVTKRNFDDRSIIQRGIRAIFLGFPLNQAGYIYWQPNTGDLGTSVDVSFDEYFHSTLSYPDLIFHDALPTRNPAPHANVAQANPSTIAYTGAPMNVPDEAKPSDPWTPYTAIPPELGPSDTQEVDPQTYQELAALPDSIILNMNDLDTFQQGDFRDAFHQVNNPNNIEYDTETTNSAPSWTPSLESGQVPLSVLEGYGWPDDSTNSTSSSRPRYLHPPGDTDTRIHPNDEGPDPTNFPQWYHDLTTRESASTHGENGTIPTHSTTHQSSYLEYDDDDTIESYPPAFHPDHEESSNSEQEETVHHRNQSLDNFPSHASNDTSNPFRNDTLPEEDNTHPHPHDQHSTLPQQSLRRSSRLQAIPNNSWDPHTRMRNNVSHANQVALLSETAFYPNHPHDTSGYEYALEAFKDSIPPPGEPGSDPLPFLPEPNRLPQVLKLPEQVQVPWLKSFVKEVRGLIVGNNCFKIETPNDSERVVPLMEVFKCKLDKFGMVDKLKCRVVFRGDLYNPKEPMDSWNPHATWISLRLYLALCARFHIFPAQIDFVMAYVQTAMREERVFVKFPAFWKYYVPDELKPYIGVPLLLLKALYGYTFSGKFLWEDQADFLILQGLRAVHGMPALWIRHLPKQGIHLVLQYSDDFLSACTDSVYHLNFKEAIKKRFTIEWQPRADWYLQARIQSDKFGNIYLDQQRYSKAVVKRYIPNASLLPTEADKLKYASPLMADMTFTKADRCLDKEALKELETIYGFRPIEAVASLNFLSNTAFEELFATRKLCSHMQFPGERHFKALLHLLHHIRCHPPNALCYYTDPTQSPLAALLRNADLSRLDPFFITITDSSWGDCDDQRSTGCYLVLFQGGLVDYSSFVPTPITLSSAEAEINAMTVGSMASSFLRQVISDVLYNDPTHPFSVPMLTDSASGIFITQNDRDTKRTRHIERRWLYVRQERFSGHIDMHFLPGDAFNLADLGTKNVASPSAAYKLSVLEAPVSDSPILPSAPPRSESKGGVGITT